VLDIVTVLTNTSIYLNRYETVTVTTQPGPLYGEAPQPLPAAHVVVTISCDVSIPRDFERT
jgi:hypothetical protein